MDKILEALAKQGRLDAEATEVAGEYKVGGERVRIETTPRKVVVYAGQARISLPKSAPSGALARAVIAALGTTPESSEKVPYGRMVGRALYLVTGPEGRALVLAPSAGVALRVGQRHTGLGSTAYLATEDEQGRHERVVLDDGSYVAIDRALSALASLR